MVLVLLKSKFTHTVISKEILNCCQNRMILKIKEYPLIRTRELKKRYLEKLSMVYIVSGNGGSLLYTSLIYYNCVYE